MDIVDVQSIFLIDGYNIKYIIINVDTFFRKKISSVASFLSLPVMYNIDGFPGTGIFEQDPSTIIQELQFG